MVTLRVDRAGLRGDMNEFSSKLRWPNESSQQIVLLVLALLLFGSLIFQLVQFTTNSRIERETARVQMTTASIQARAAEDVQWREALRMLAENPTFQTSYSGAALLTTFVRQGHYRDEARTLAFYILGKIGDADTFEHLFDSAIEATPEAERVHVIIKIGQQLKNSYSGAESEEKALGGPPPGDQLPVLPSEGGKDLPNPYWLVSQINQEVLFLCNYVAPGFRKARSPGDLSGAVFWDCDLSGVNFSNTTIDNIDFGGVNLNNANFSGVNSFTDSWWGGSAWWRAKNMSPELLAYLTEKFPYSKKTNYGFYNSGISENEYHSDLTRLKQLER